VAVDKRDPHGAAGPCPGSGCEWGWWLVPASPAAVSGSCGKSFPVAGRSVFVGPVLGAGVGWDAPAGSAEVWRASCLPPCASLPGSCLPFQKS